VKVVIFSAIDTEDGLRDIRVYCRVRSWRLASFLVWLLSWRTSAVEGFGLGAADEQEFERIRLEAVERLNGLAGVA